MKRNYLAVFALAVGTMMIAAGAFASDQSARAARRAPRGHHEQGCTLYSYQIEKIGPSFAQKGETVTYHVFVSNLGDCFLRDIDVKEVLPWGMRFVSATPAPTWVHDGKIGWKDVELKKGRYIDFVVEAEVEHARENDVLSNRACAFTPLIGQQICGAISTTIEEGHHHPHP